MSEGYRARRVDRNQSEIVSILRRLGYAVKPLHEAGNGMFDLPVSKHGLTALVEVKDGLKPPSHRELTPAQKRFNFEWQGLRCVVANADDCVRFHESFSVIVAKIHASGIAMEIEGNREDQYKPCLY